MLLRFLDNGEIQRVGAPSSTRVDVRVIAATNVDLAAHVVAGKFRLDLYYRLNVIRLQTTALRDRREDIPILLAHFLDLYASGSSVPVPSLTPVALNRLVRHEWPGNVRELRSMAERLVATRHTHQVEVHDISGDLSWAHSRVERGVQDEPCRPGTVIDDVYKRISNEGESFWTVFHAPFMARECTRADLRSLVTLALEATCGNYQSVVRLFNMEARDHKRFLNFLWRHNCMVDHRRFRSS